VYSLGAFAPTVRSRSNREIGADVPIGGVGAGEGGTGLSVGLDVYRSCSDKARRASSSLVW